MYAGATQGTSHNSALTGSVQHGTEPSNPAPQETNKRSKPYRQTIASRYVEKAVDTDLLERLTTVQYAKGIVLTLEWLLSTRMKYV